MPRFNVYTMLRAHLWPTESKSIFEKVILEGLNHFLYTGKGVYYLFGEESAIANASCQAAVQNRSNCLHAMIFHTPWMLSVQQIIQLRPDCKRICIFTALRFLASRDAKGLE